MSSKIKIAFVSFIFRYLTIAASICRFVQCSQRVRIILNVRKDNELWEWRRWHRVSCSINSRSIFHIFNENSLSFLASWKRSTRKYYAHWSRSAYLRIHTHAEHTKRASERTNSCRTKQKWRLPISGNEKGCSTFFHLPNLDSRQL